jgi:hypothetical protein
MRALVMMPRLPTITSEAREAALKPQVLPQASCESISTDILGRSFR